MSKRKHLAVRKPGGRIYSYGSQPSELLSPTEVRRLVDGAAMGLKDSTWSSTLGRLHLAGKLNASQLVSRQAMGGIGLELFAGVPGASSAQGEAA